MIFSAVSNDLVVCPRQLTQVFRLPGVVGLVPGEELDPSPQSGFPLSFADLFGEISPRKFEQAFGKGFLGLLQYLHDFLQGHNVCTLSGDRVGILSVTGDVFLTHQLGRVQGLYHDLAAGSYMSEDEVQTVPTEEWLDQAVFVGQSVDLPFDDEQVAFIYIF